MFSPHIGWKPLAMVCRALATMLHSGVDIQRAFQLAAAKTADRRCREAMQGVSEAIARGDDVTSAMQGQRGAFPDLMIDMVHVAEQTGMLPEVLRSLAGHYENLLRLRKEFVQGIAWPVFQYVAAVCVVGLAIYVLGIVGNGQTDTLGLGLTGASGALIWYGLNIGVVGGVIAAYLLTARTLAGRQAVHSALLKVPVVGRCLRAFAIARFSWAFALTQQAGMSIGPSLKTSLRATGNGAFQTEAPAVWQRVKTGETLTEALTATRLFPTEYLHMVDVAEHSGTVPEMLDRLGPEFEDEARRSMAALTAAAGWGVWVLVAGFIIFLIFSIMLTYVGMLNSFGNI